jgi:hypothetical protein
MAAARLSLVKRCPKDANANFIFEAIYTSLTELLHALLIQNGFKANDHVSLGFYLKDVLGREDLYSLFDQCRMRRNHLVYDGKMMPADIAVSAVATARRLVRELDGMKA